MNWLLIVGSVIGLIFALLLARGVYLIGSGSKVELKARDRMSGDLSRTGWMTLDGLRKGNIPIVSWIENKLGINQDDESE